jgi:hypothetical protein
MHRLAASGHFDTLQIPVVYSARTYELFDLSDDLRFEGCFEAPFFTSSREAISVSESWASAHCSQASQ